MNELNAVTRDEVIRAVGRYVRFPGAWTIGLTSDLEQSRQEHGAPRFWYKWNAESATDARTIKDHLTCTGMKSHPDRGDAPSQVYICLRSGARVLPPSCV